MIRLRNLIMDYNTPTGRLRALECPHLDIAEGSSVAVTGPSGCGKSTMLAMLSGLEAPTTGEVDIDDVALSALSGAGRTEFRKQALGIVYQKDSLLPFLTVAQNIRLQLAICGDTNAAAERTDALLKGLGLAGHAGRLPDQLSGGERQRVAVARAVVHSPSVILADEPTGALDGANAAGVIALLEQVRRRLGATLVIVTHDPKVTAAMNRRIALASGKVVSDTGVTNAD